MINFRSETEQVWAVILAAGSGSRLASVLDKPKQFIEWSGLPLYWHSALVFSRCPCLKGLVFVFPEEFRAREQQRVKKLSHMNELGLKWKIVSGGPSRRDSAANGLKAVPANSGLVFIHDAARPFFSSALLQKLLNASDEHHAGVIPAIPVTDTIKIVKDGTVKETLPRDQLFAVQTPQLFKTGLLRAAHERALSENWQATDDAALIEKSGLPVKIVNGEHANIKITQPRDLELLREADSMWIPSCGFGYDVHRYGPGRALRLGGVPIPGGMEVIAHSDGDVLLHALIDALLGAAALGDIGKLFPPADPRYEGISSAVLLDHALGLFRQEGFILSHVDLTIVAQKPRLEAWKGEIARNVGRLLTLDARQVGLKATTEEGLGFTGNCSGIKAYALVSALRKADRQTLQRLQNS